MDEMTSIELGRDVDGQAQLAPGRLDTPGVRNRAHEVSSQADESLHVAGQHSFAAFHRCEPLLARRFEPVQLLQLVKWCELRFFSNSDGSLSLTFEWPRTGQMPAPGLPMLPRSSK